MQTATLASTEVPHKTFGTRPPLAIAGLPTMGTPLQERMHGN